MTRQCRPSRQGKSRGPKTDRLDPGQLSCQQTSDQLRHLYPQAVQPLGLGNAGSFFKNPSVSKEQFDQLKNEFASLVAFVNPDGTMKLAAGWLIEQCGWKGYRKGDAGCHAKQALVLVNYGTATGNEIFDLSEEIMQSVKVKFGVDLERVKASERNGNGEVSFLINHFNFFNYLIYFWFLSYKIFNISSILVFYESICNFIILPI